MYTLYLCSVVKDSFGHKNWSKEELVSGKNPEVLKTHTPKNFNWVQDKNTYYSDIINLDDGEVYAFSKENFDAIIEKKWYQIDYQN